LRELARRQVLPTLPALDLVLRSRPDAYHGTFDQLAGDLDAWRHSL
jgi:hypothetical protein